LLDRRRVRQGLVDARGLAVGDRASRILGAVILFFLFFSFCIPCFCLFFVLLSFFFLSRAHLFCSADA
jgi:hypothetical protein